MIKSRIALGSSIRLTEKKDHEASEPEPSDPGAKRPRDWSAVERAKLVLEAAALGDQELG